MPDDQDPPPIDDHATEDSTGDPTLLSPEDAIDVLKTDVANLINKAASGRTLSAADRQLLLSISKGEGPIDPSRYVATIVDLAKELGVSRKTVQRHLRKKGHPETRADGRYDVTAWKAYLRTVGDMEAKDDEEKIKREKEKQLRLANERAQFDFDVARGEYVRKTDMEQWVTEMIFRSKKVLLAMPGALAPQLAGLTVPEIEDELRKSINEALSHLSGEYEGEKEEDTDGEPTGSRGKSGMEAAEQAIGHRMVRAPR